MNFNDCLLPHRQGDELICMTSSNLRVKLHNTRRKAELKEVSSYLFFMWWRQNFPSWICWALDWAVRSSTWRQTLGIDMESMVIITILKLGRVLFQHPPLDSKLYSPFVLGNVFSLQFGKYREVYSCLGRVQGTGENQLPHPCAGGSCPLFLRQGLLLSWGEHEWRIMTYVLGEFNWIQGPVKPVTFIEKLFIFTRFLRNPN